MDVLPWVADVYKRELDIEKYFIDTIEGLVLACGLPAIPRAYIIESDALNAFAGKVDRLSGRDRALILTPHPGEMARLTGSTAAAIQEELIMVSRYLERNMSRNGMGEDMRKSRSRDMNMVEMDAMTSANDFANSYGYLDIANREYVITRPDTPTPWINYLGCEDYFGLISNTAGGYSFYKDARLRRITRYRYNNVPSDRPGRYIYIRDAQSGDYWSATWQPVLKDLERFNPAVTAALARVCCRMSTSSTISRSSSASTTSRLTGLARLPQLLDFRIGETNI